MLGSQFVDQLDEVKKNKCYNVLGLDFPFKVDANLSYVYYNKLTCFFSNSLEKELVLEIERLKKKNGPTKKTKIPSKLDIFIRSIEEDRDYYRAQADDLQVGCHRHQDKLRVAGQILSSLN